MRKWKALCAGMVGLALMPSAAAEASELSRPTDTSIRTTLSLLPAQLWSAEVGGFSAFDLKAIWAYLGVAWPEGGAEADDAAWLAAIQQVVEHVSPPPRVLWPWVIGDPDGYYAELGLDQTAIGAVAEMPGLGPVRISAVVGDGVADASRLTSAIGPGAMVGDVDGSAYWDARGVGRDELLLNDQLLAFPPDIVIAHDSDLDPAALANVVVGNAPNLMHEPIVDALLQAVDGAAVGTLVTLLAMRTDRIVPMLGPDADDWPDDAALPAYEMVAFGLRFDAETATSTIALMYQDEATAQAAFNEMRTRLPFASSQIDMPVDEALLVETTSGWQAVTVSSDRPISALGQQDATTAYAAWLQSMIRLLDMRLLGPSTP